MPTWAVIVVSSLAFGLGHSYQGAGGVARVTLIGLAFGAFYVFTGTIWLPMLAHAVLDIVQGASILEILRKVDDPDAELR
jgi:membrane protease YdiL (CAAX protease family)